VRIETVPLILGIITGLIGLGLLADAWIPEDAPPFRERRRRTRRERSLGGEAMIGLGVLCLAAALISRDSWDYVNIAVIAGGVLLLLGTWLNRKFLRDLIANRGVLRRGDASRAHRHEKDAPPPPKPRIR
jgi:hypothetical protein